MLLNLKPDKDGLIELPIDTLGGRQHVHVVVADPQQTASRSISLPESESLTRDLRLVQGLDQQKHFTEQKQVSVVKSGEKFVLADIRSSQFQVTCLVWSNSVVSLFRFSVTHLMSSPFELLLVHGRLFLSDFSMAILQCRSRGTFLGVNVGVLFCSNFPPRRVSVA